MKKYLVLLIVLTTVFIVNDLFKASSIVIPKEAIRLRIIANSNSSEDQNIKLKIKDDLEPTIMNLLKNTKSTVEARKKLKTNLPLVKEKITKTLEENNCNTSFLVSYGNNYFPSKNYKGVVYNSGNYESLVIKLGKGEGNNFWCVLFPPLCLIEESNKNIEYHILAKDIINKYF